MLVDHGAGGCHHEPMTIMTVAPATRQDRTHHVTGWCLQSYEIPRITKQQLMLCFHSCWLYQKHQSRWLHQASFYMFLQFFTSIIFHLDQINEKDDLPLSFLVAPAVGHYSGARSFSSMGSNPSWLTLQQRLAEVIPQLDAGRSPVHRAMVFHGVPSVTSTGYRKNWGSME